MSKGIELFNCHIYRTTIFGNHQMAWTLSKQTVARRFSQPNSKNIYIFVCLEIIRVLKNFELKVKSNELKV